jgi:hypothetical protein
MGLLPADTGTLVFSTYAIDPADAMKPFEPNDTAALKRFVTAGGRLVVLDDDFEGKEDVTPGVGKSISATATGAIPLARDRYTAGVERVSVPIDALLPFDTHDGLPLLANDRGLVGVRYALGKGEVIAITAPRLFSNAFLAHADNARFAYNVLAGHGPVLFDEYVHGFDDNLSFWGALPGPVRLAFWIVCAIVLLALIGANVPFAPPIPLEPPDERDSSAYIDAMGALMRRARAARAAIGTFAADAARSRRTTAESAKIAVAQLEGLAAISHPSEAALLDAAALNYRLRKDIV